MIPLLSVAAAHCPMVLRMIPYVGAGFAGLPSSAIPAELDVAFGSWLCKKTLSQGPEWDEVLMRTGLSGFDYARIAAISGCMPIMFITLVRL